MFIKCICCKGGPVRIFRINTYDGSVNSKCFGCGFTSENTEGSFRKAKLPEIIWIKK